MSELTEQNPLLLAMRAEYKRREGEEPRRTHLGASGIGNECARAIWYGWRWAYRADFPGRMLRLFERGHREEPWVVRDLRAVGLEVQDFDPETGMQWANSDAEMGDHFSSASDGRVFVKFEDDLGVTGWGVLEIKTSNTKGFKAMKRSGVRLAKPTHYDQMQTYMGWQGLPFALYIMVCKETDDIHIEVVHFDAKRFESIRQRARMVLEAPEPLSKVSNSDMVPPCVYCDAKPLCFENKVADVNCRTCVHSTAILHQPGAGWGCEKRGEYISRELQETGCDEHVFIPALVPYGEAIDAGDGWVKYRMRGKEANTVFLNVAKSANITNEDAKNIDGPHQCMTSRALHAVEPMDFDGVPTEEELRGTAWDMGFESEREMEK